MDPSLQSIVTQSTAIQALQSSHDALQSQNATLTSELATAQAATTLANEQLNAAIGIIQSDHPGDTVTVITKSPYIELGQAPAPTTLTLSPTSASLSGVGQTQRFVATVKDQFGNVLTPGQNGVPALVWLVLDTTVITTDQTGLVTERGAGTTVVQAVCGSIASAIAQVTCTVPLSGGTTGPGLNYPSGMTPVMNTGAITTPPANFSQNGGQPGFTWSITGPTGIVTHFNMDSPQNQSSTGDWAANLFLTPSTDVSPSGGGYRIAFLPTLEGSGSPVRFHMSPGFSTTGTGYCYISFRFRLSPAFGFSTASGIKFFEIITTVSNNNDYFGWSCASPTTGLQDGVSAFPFVGLQGNHVMDLPGAPLGGQMNNESLAFATAGANIGGANRGAWNTVELYFIPETPLNVGTNGQLVVWINGVKEFDTRGLTPGGTNSGLPNNGITYDWGGFSSINFGPTYGGDSASDHPPTGTWIDFDNFFVAVA